MKKLIEFRVTRFVLVGMSNTVINFMALNFAYFVLSQSKLVSSFIATFLAMTFSFLLNRQFVFMDKSSFHRQLVPFAIVTMTGVLLLQNGIYAICLSILTSHSADIQKTVHDFTGVFLARNFIVINLGNLLASLVVMIWNYNGYRVFVFNNNYERHGDDVIKEA